MDLKDKITAVVFAIILLSIGLFAYEVTGHHTSTITATDSFGHTVTFNHTVTRIISVDPSATATLYALGAYKDLVGGNAYDAYPPNSTLPNVGDSFGINMEEVLNLSPELVLLYGSTVPGYTSTLNSTHIPYLVDNPESILQIEQLTTMLGLLTGTESNASLINQWMNQSLSAINSTSAKITESPYTAFYFLSDGGWTAGHGTYIDSIMRYAHLKNIANGSDYYQMPNELIAQDNPQVILLDQYVNYSSVNQTPYDKTSAFYDNKIFTIFNDNFFQEPDFRIIYAITWLLDTIYPQVSAYLSLQAFPVTLLYPPTTGM